MEKKIEVEVGGRKVRVMEHMLDDIIKLGGVKTKKIIKDVPIELLKVPAKSPLPEMIITGKVKEVKLTPEPAKFIEPVKEVVIEPVKTVIPTFEKPARKTPVRSKAKK